MYARALALVLLSAAVLAPAAGYIVPRKATPSSYATGYLEPYQQYHTRYLAIGCENHHHKGAFFDACCHPLLATENLETARPSYCIPSTLASSSASAAEPTSTVTTPADGDHHDDDDSDSDSDSESDHSSKSSFTSQRSTESAPTPTHSDSDSSSKSSFTPQPTTESTTPTPTPTHSIETETEVAATTTSTTTSAQADPTHGFVDNAASESSAVFTGGQATYFYQNGVAGACGTVHSDYDWIVAIDEQRYGNSGAVSQYCGKTVTITGNGVTKQAMVADDCPTCSGPNSLDMSLGLFEQFASLDEGVFPISWSFVN